MIAAVPIDNPGIAFIEDEVTGELLRTWFAH
jgi:hypothetical protein